MTSNRWRRLAVLGAVVAVTSTAVVFSSGAIGRAQPAHRSALRGLSIEWPSQGQAAIAIPGVGQSASRPAADPAPIASVAKVMTAYVVLARFPLASNGNGFAMTMSALNQAEAKTDASQGQSFVPVEAGEVLTERQALEALLLPSGHNIARALAVRTAGSEAAFVVQMNHQAAALGMSHTTYTDPSGLDPHTVSTAADQLRLARAALRVPALAQIMSQRTATIPVAGLITSTDTLLGHDGFLAGKTGSDQAAGGCFMFEAVRLVGGRPVTIVGVALGQRSGPLIQAGLGAADHLVGSIAGELSLRPASGQR